MPYKVYKKGSGYKACKKGGKKCFSKKPMSKQKAQAQMKAMYANESVQLNERLKEETEVLEYKTLRKYPKRGDSPIQWHVDFQLGDKKEVLFTLVYETNTDTFEDLDYKETHVTDPSVPSIQVFDNPYDSEAEAILEQYGLTPDSLELAGDESFIQIEKHYPKEEEVKENFEFEKVFSLIMGNEQEADKKV